MSSYNIDYSDPLKDGFEIPAGGYNGPGGSQAATSLRLYGRGALEWGEAVDEDLLRLAENFASASPPSEAITGQLWLETSLYCHVGGVATTGWYYYDLNETVNSLKWKLIGGTGIVNASPPVSPTEGQYYYDGTHLYGYYSLGRYEPIAFVRRSFFSSSVVPVAPGVVPPQYLRVFDGNASGGAWTTPAASAVSTSAPTGAQVGSLWYNSTTGILSVWNGSAWRNILGPSAGGVVTATGPIAMSGLAITGLATPSGSDSTQAVNVGYLTTVSGAYLPLTGGTISGNLTVTNTTTLNVMSAGSSTVASLGVTGAASINGVLTMNTTRITGVAAPSVGSDATNKTYVDGTIASTVAGYLPLSGGTVTGNLNVTGVTSSGFLSVTGTASVGGTLNMNTQRILNVADPVVGTDGANKNYVDNFGGVPPGAVMHFAMASPPTGWLACNGAPVSRATYSALFAAIGTTYGIGNGTTTFNLPDLRGEFIRGFDAGRGVDSGRVLGSAQADELRSHTHLVRASPSGNGAASTGPFVEGAFSSATSATGGVETRPRNIAMLACIKH